MGRKARSGRRGSSPARARRPSPSPSPAEGHEAKEVHGGDVEEVLKVFKRFDANGDGFVDRGDLVRILCTLDPATWSERKLSCLFHSADQNHDGRIDYEEFFTWVFSSGSEQADFHKSMAKSSLAMLKVRTLAGAEVAVKAEEYETIAQIEQRIAAELGVEAECIKLFKEGVAEALLSDRCLKEYEICSTSTESELSVVIGMSAIQAMVAEMVEELGSEEARRRLHMDYCAYSEECMETQSMKRALEADFGPVFAQQQQAIRDLDGLRWHQDDIKELRRLRKPPALVQTIGEAMCVLLSFDTVCEEEPSWEYARKLLHQPKTFDQMKEYHKNYDRDEVTHKETIIHMLGRYYHTITAEGFSEAVCRQSKHAVGICQWLQALCQYDKISENACSKKMILRRAKDLLSVAEKRLEEVSRKITTLDTMEKKDRPGGS